MSQESQSYSSWPLFFMAWVIASVATLGSLFFSEVMSYPPCVLCWYQRICMYPLVPLFLARLFKKDDSCPRYTFPLAIIGFGISIYHNLLYFKVIPESASPCAEGISCTVELIEWFGFITIPFLSGAAFLLILILLLINQRNLKYEE